MCKVLVIDDDVDILEVIKMMLVKKGLLVDTLFAGDKVFDHIEEHKPDIILLDINLGTHDGRVICKKIKELSTTQHIPVIIFSANHNIKQSAMDNKADHFLAKPFDMQELLALVKSYCPHELN